MSDAILPLGKLPPELLAQLVAQIPSSDPRVLLGPGVGLDCAVIDTGAPQLLVLKTEPITFVSAEIGWYGVQVGANDIATTGAVPRWYMTALLLPQGQTTPRLVEEILNQINSACAQLGITVVGGHTEITHGLDRPLLIGTLIGEVAREALVTPRGAQSGDRILLTKGVPVEATAILSREFPDRLAAVLSPAELEEAAAYLYTPGISVARDARIAVQAGRVTAMHDPTEGGLASALWEMAEASGKCFKIDPAAVPVPRLSRRVCEVFGLNPLAAIASGALLFTAPPSGAPAVCAALQAEGILCAEIGEVSEGPFAVWQRLPGGEVPLPRPERDEITRVYE